MGITSAATARSRRRPAAPSSGWAATRRASRASTSTVDDGDRYRFGEAEAEVIFVPGHTIGHMRLCVQGAAGAVLRRHVVRAGLRQDVRGHAAAVLDSLERLRALPDEMRVYCAHEYTQSNARFAVTIETDNPQLMARRRSIDAARARGEATVPSLLGEEKQTNPFLRADKPGVQKAVGMSGGTRSRCSPRCATARTCSGRTATHVSAGIAVTRIPAITANRS